MHGAEWVKEFSYFFSKKKKFCWGYGMEALARNMVRPCELICKKHLIIFIRI